MADGLNEIRAEQPRARLGEPEMVSCVIQGQMVRSAALAMRVRGPTVTVFLEANGGRFVDGTRR